MNTTQESLRELAERGVGFDMIPTMMFTTAESMYSQWLGYFTRLDQAWRERVSAAADALSTSPADDVQCGFAPDAGMRCIQQAGHGGLGHMVPDVATAEAARERMTPPADDVRDLLIEAIDGCIPDDIPGYRQRYTDKAADAILAAFEVRPRGTVAESEVEAAYRAYIAARGFDPKEWIRHALEAARGVRS